MKPLALFILFCLAGCTAPEPKIGTSLSRVPRATTTN